MPYETHDGDSSFYRTDDGKLYYIVDDDRWKLIKEDKVKQYGQVWNRDTKKFERKLLWDDVPLDSYVKLETDEERMHREIYEHHYEIGEKDD